MLQTRPLRRAPPRANDDAFVPVRLRGQCAIRLDDRDPTRPILERTGLAMQRLGLLAGDSREAVSCICIADDEAGTETWRIYRSPRGPGEMSVIEDVRIRACRTPAGHDALGSALSGAILAHELATCGPMAMRDLVGDVQSILYANGRRAGSPMEGEARRDGGVIRWQPLEHLATLFDGAILYRRETFGRETLHMDWLGAGNAEFMSQVWRER